MASGSCLDSTDRSDTGIHDLDATFQTLLNSYDGSVSQLFDAVFAFLARNKPESFSASGISLEHIISQSLHKWRTTLQQEKLSRAGPTASSPVQKCPMSVPAGTDVIEKSSVKNCEHSSNVQSTLEKDESGLLNDQILFKRAANNTSEVIAEEIVETSKSVTGGDAEHSEVYTWSQTMEDVNIKIPVPPDVIKGRQLAVEIGDSSVYVAVKASPEAVLLRGVLRQPVDSSESLWDLQPGRHVTLHLSKREARWWRDSAVVGVQGAMEGATEPERDFSSMAEDEQADIRRIVFDAEQKAAGKPTSDTLKMESLLRSAWNAPNSPFQGQEFDLSKVNVVPQGP